MLEAVLSTGYFASQHGWAQDDQGWLGSLSFAAAPWNRAFGQTNGQTRTSAY